MSPTPQETSWVTNKETEEAYEMSEEHTEDNRGKTPGPVAWQERLRRNVWRLTRMEPRGNKIPKVGTHCLVMVGNVTQDVGQIARVTKLTVKMVEITSCDAKKQRFEHKLKRPNSLIMLDAGVTMVQDVHGTVWICAQT
jgi:sialic acid synthase SpsE